MWSRSMHMQSQPLAGQTAYSLNQSRMCVMWPPAIQVQYKGGSTTCKCLDGDVDSTMIAVAAPHEPVVYRRRGTAESLFIAVVDWFGLTPTVLPTNDALWQGSSTLLTRHHLQM